MFGPKGPRSKRPGAAGRAGGAPAPRGGGVTETIISGAPVAAPARRAKPAGDGASDGRRRTQARAVTRLVDLASDWLATALALGHVAELPDAAALRARALELKGRFERDAGEQGFTAADTDDAVFAMVAFLDETILNNRGGAREVWISRPLQLELYGRQLAGEEFFERLDRLRRDRETRIEALEVYACCLAFGFAGRFRLSPPEKLAELIADTLRDVEAVRGANHMPLAPNSARRNEQVAEEVRGLPWWLAPAVFVPAVALSFVIIWLLAKLGAGHSASHITNLTGR